MKCRVFKKPDGRVIYSWPSSKYQDDFSKCKFPPETIGLPYVDLDESDLPSEEGRDWYSHGPLTMDGDCSKENLKFDENWAIHLMPKNVLRRKNDAKIDADLDTELAKETPDPIKIARLQRDKEKSKSFTDKQWYEQALVNLDKRVEGGESDKPLIRQKLQQKILES